jgi:hypothetical protein
VSRKGDAVLCDARSRVREGRPVGRAKAVGWRLGYVRPDNVRRGSRPPAGLYGDDSGRRLDAARRFDRLDGAWRSTARRSTTMGETIDTQRSIAQFFYGPHVVILRTKNGRVEYARKYFALLREFTNRI